MRKLKNGEQGAEVRLLQQALNARSKSRGLPLVEVDGELGPQTAAAVQRVGRALGAAEATLKIARTQGFIPVGLQRIIRWPQGRTPAQLKRAAERKAAAKGQAGTLRARAVKIALHEVGVMEVGSNNRGKRVEEIIRYALGDVPEPWCVDFVIWAYGHAGSQVVRPGFTRAVAYMHTDGLVQTRKPRMGDIVRYEFDHTGLFLRWIGDGWFLSVEGNTGASGAVSDSKTGGDGVYLKKRHVSQVTDFLVVTR